MNPLQTLVLTLNTIVVDHPTLSHDLDKETARRLGRNFTPDAQGEDEEWHETLNKVIIEMYMLAAETMKGGPDGNTDQLQA